MYEMIDTKVGTVTKVLSEFTWKDGKQVKLTRYFKLADWVSKSKFELRADLQNSDFLKKNIEDILVPMWKCEPINLAELAEEM